MKLFIKSYEDNTYIGRNINMGIVVAQIIAGSKFPRLDFNESIEFLKEHGSGDFIFVQSREALEQFHEDAHILGE